MSINQNSPNNTPHHENGFKRCLHSLHKVIRMNVKITSILELRNKLKIQLVVLCGTMTSTSFGDDLSNDVISLNASNTTFDL